MAQFTLKSVFTIEVDDHRLVRSISCTQDQNGISCWRRGCFWQQCSGHIRRLSCFSAWVIVTWTSANAIFLRKCQFGKYLAKITSLYDYLPHRDTVSAFQQIHRSNLIRIPCCHCIDTNTVQPTNCSHPDICSNHNLFPSPSRRIINLLAWNWSFQLNYLPHIGI